MGYQKNVIFQKGKGRRETCKQVLLKMEEKKGNLPVEEQGNVSIDTNNEVEEKELELEMQLPNVENGEGRVKQAEQFDVTQAEFEIYNLVTDLSEIYSEMYNNVGKKIDLEAKENAELLLTFADFDTALAISSLLSLELMNVIRTVFKDDPNSIQTVLTAVIKNVNASMEEITPEEIEPMDEFDDIPDETPIVYN